MKTVLVIAAAHREFIEFVETVSKERLTVRGRADIISGDTRYIWIRELDYMRGMRPQEIHFIGQWYRLDGKEEIRDYAKVLKHSNPDMEVFGLSDYLR